MKKGRCRRFTVRRSSSLLLLLLIPITDVSIHTDGHNVLEAILFIRFCLPLFMCARQKPRAVWNTILPIHPSVRLSTGVGEFLLLFLFRSCSPGSFGSITL